MISASTGSTTNRDDELVGQIERCLHRPIIPENWFFCQLNPFTLLGVLAPFKGDTELILGGNFRRVLRQIWTA
jgi:hypothetical protein